MGHINVLDKNMINMIAAGEVIERPASVVKELTENSIDAGATRISVSIEDGGKRLIAVTDNGRGMDATDLPAAFESHATSKIKTSDDLRKIATLGFRGEALASIASVAAVRAVSRQTDAISGNSIEIDCGNRQDVQPCSADCGTTIAVRDIFYKLPARRKFLRTANTEFTHVSEQFTRIALANCNLELQLHHNNRQVHHLTAGQSLRERIGELFSEDVAAGLIETTSQEKQLNILALLGPASLSRANNRLQYTFLNGRFIRDKFISHAIREAYRGLLEPDRHPVVFLFISMPHEDYDVNVHPTKTEVRFYNANLVHSQILGALREKLLASDMDMPGKIPQAPSAAPNQSSDYREQAIRDAMSDFLKKHRAGAPQKHFTFGSGTATKTFSQSDRLTALEHARMQTATVTAADFIQIHDSYIVEQTDEGFVVIDQHALHERILYNDLKQRLCTGNLESQKLLVPESFNVTPAQKDVFGSHADLFAKLGIELTEFGPRSLAVQAFPTLLAKAAPAEFVCDLLDLLIEKADVTDTDILLDEVISMAACKAAIKAGQRLSDTEIHQLLSDRELAEKSSRCPHGRPATITFTLAELQKQFKRT